MMIHDTIISMRVRDVLAESIKGKRGCLSAKDVRKVLGINASVLQQWLARDLIPFETIDVGKRTWRRFAILDLPRLVVIGEIVAQGLPVGEAVENVDTILDWKYKPGTVPGVILWLRQIKTIYFMVASESVAAVLREYDCASCILFSVDELKLKIAAVVRENEGTRFRMKVQATVLP